ncbi:unnamed protein product, partial [Oppiella nova]
DDSDLDLVALCKDVSCQSTRRTISHPSNNGKYIICNDSQSGNTIQKCGPGLLFDEKVLSCNYAGLVDSRGPSGKNLDLFVPKIIIRWTSTPQRSHGYGRRIPDNMRGNTCGDYIAKGKKFKARKGETYFGLKVFRFYMRCPRCMADITLKTDLKNMDKVVEHGVTPIFKALQLGEREVEGRQEEKEEHLNPMKNSRNSRTGKGVVGSTGVGIPVPHDSVNKLMDKELEVEERELLARIRAGEGSGDDSSDNEVRLKFAVTFGTIDGLSNNKSDNCLSNQLVAKESLKRKIDNFVVVKKKWSKSMSGRGFPLCRQKGIQFTGVLVQSLGRFLTAVDVICVTHESRIVKLCAVMVEIGKSFIKAKRYS